MKNLTPENMAVLKAIYDRHSDMDKMIDTKTYVLSAIFAGTLFLSINTFVSFGSKLSFLLDTSLAVLSFVSFLSLILSIASIKPRMLQRHSPLNLFFYGHFLNKLSEDEYAKKLDEILRDRKNVLKEFTKKIYSLSNNVLVPGFRKIRIASDIFVAGLIISGLLIMLSLIM